METNIQIAVKGIPEDLANNIRGAFNAVLNAFMKVDGALDLRRMYQVVVTTDFAAEMVELSKRTISGNPITYTNEEYAVAIAKVFSFPHEDDYENLLVFDANVAACLLMYEGSENYNKELFDNALHLLHHELCHVHDNNKKIDALSSWMRYHYVGKNILIFPLAEACWSEYIANYMSSSSATKSEIEKIIQSFRDAIARTKPQLDKAIFDYRYHADLDKLMDESMQHGGFLVKIAAYTMGYLDGLSTSLEDLSDDAAKKLTGSYFEPTWDSMHNTLKNMHELYPSKWKDIGIFDELASVIEHYYSDLGFVLSTTEDGKAYVDIPFRPENTPPD